MATMLPGRATQHLLGFLAHGFHLAGILVDRDDRRLIDHDAFALGEDQRVRGAQVDGEIGRE